MPSVTAVAAAVARLPHPTFFEDPADLRRAVVYSVILGRPKALEPHRRP